MLLPSNTEKLGIGLMSGTSMDGVDAALVKICGTGTDTEVHPQYNVHLPFSHETRRKIKDVCSVDSSNIQLICEMNFLLGEKFADAAIQLMEKDGRSLNEVDFVSSHGQTVYHLPPNSEEGHISSTLQIGDISVIAQRTGRPVVGDFRPADMAVGGQGAPLIPYADYLLFHSENKGRAIQNIGGIGNVTFLPLGGDSEQVIAYDTGPGNMIIDQVVESLTDGEKTYDQDGDMGGKGKVDKELVKQWLQDPYFSINPPKSTGREKFGKQYAVRLMNDAAHLSINNLIATVTAFTAHSIVDSYERFILPEHKIDEIILGGGGSHNRTLIRMIERLLPGVKVMTHEDYDIDGDFKEAIAFVIIANEFMQGSVNTLPSATGASRPVTMGKLALPYSAFEFI